MRFWEIQVLENKVRFEIFFGRLLGMKADDIREDLSIIVKCVLGRDKIPAAFLTPGTDQIVFCFCHRGSPPFV